MPHHMKNDLDAAAILVGMQTLGLKNQNTKLKSTIRKQKDDIASLQHANAKLKTRLSKREQNYQKAKKLAQFFLDEYNKQRKIVQKHKRTQTCVQCNAKQSVSWSIGEQRSLIPMIHRTTRGDSKPCNSCGKPTNNKCKVCSDCPNPGCKLGWHLTPTQPLP